MQVVPESWYAVLKNPARNGKQPPLGDTSSVPDNGLIIGHKTNIPGPISFPLWPTQMVDIRRGHRMRTNQYIVARVYNEAESAKNWGSAITEHVTADADVPKPDAEDQEPKVSLQLGGEPEASVSEPSSKDTVKPPKKESVKSQKKMTTGTLFIIRGTDVSFYIPPTGIEVIPDDSGEFVRDGVTLEQLEYCILLDENGKKRYLRGPDVVFPEATETFQIGKVDGRPTRKFRATELTDLKGVHIRVTEEYNEDGRTYKVGEEIFITGKDTNIYYPRPEHAVIKYDGNMLHYAIAIPKGEARYVLDQNTGSIRLVRGEKMFLPNPINEVIVRRVLTSEQFSLWFPDNKEALDVNQKRYEEQNPDISQTMYSSGSDSPLRARSARGGSLGERMKGESDYLEVATDAFIGDQINRKSEYTPPRTIILDNKYEGAVTINLWPGYAVQVIGKDGIRRVVTGPTSFMLEYDEILQKFSLSSGKPKTTNHLIDDVYLRVTDNTITDIVRVETQDFCEVSLRLVYSVDFTGPSDKWFNVENYVKFLCDHVRSVLKAEIRKLGIEDFYAKSTEILRDIILGTKEGKDGNRAGMLFDSNGMKIKDVEILQVSLEDEDILEILTEAKKQEVISRVTATRNKMSWESEKDSQETKRKIKEEYDRTDELSAEIKAKETKRQSDQEMLIQKNANALVQESEDAKKKLQATVDAIHKSEMERIKAKNEERIRVLQEELNIQLSKVEKEAEAEVAKANAVTPQLVEALTALGQQMMMAGAAEHLAPLSIVRDQSLAGVLAQFFEGTPMVEAVHKLVSPRG